jgi:LTXXQ motif family protein
MKAKALILVASFICINGSLHSSAMAFTPTFSMIKKACREMPDGIQRQLVGVEAKLKVAANQQQSWKDFTTDAENATKPMKKICKEKFGPDAVNPGWFAPAAERDKAEGDKQQFMAVMELMSKEMESAVATLKTKLSPEQVGLLEREFAKR